MFNNSNYSIRKFVFNVVFLTDEWMNECLTTPQHEKQIGYWVSEKGKCLKWVLTDSINNDSLNTFFIYNYLASNSW